VENKIRVMVVDDSLFVRTILSDMLSDDPEIEIVGIAKDGVEAVELAERIRPDIVTMDLEMPRADGIEALKMIKERDSDISVLMLSASDKASAEAILKSLEIGAFDFILKPSSTSSTDLLRMKWEIITKIKAAVLASGKEFLDKIETPILEKKEEKRRVPRQAAPVITIGASTGGPIALRYILSKMPRELKSPLIIAQHMPKAFTETFADRLDKYCKIRVVEAVDKDGLVNGWAYIAPGDSHIEIAGSGRDLSLRLTLGERISGGRPSVDMLFRSGALALGPKIIGVLLTGMGNDGSRGMKHIKESGGYTIAQDEESSLIWGMPHAAVRLGVVDQILPLREIPRALLAINGVIA